LPILLNQVQAKVASPVVRFVGILKEYVLGSTASAESPLFPATPWIGQPPMMEWMTLKVLDFVGALSYVIEIWQDPPPWVALPVNLSG
jgi:hypothetical protein